MKNMKTKGFQEVKEGRQLVPMTYLLLLFCIYPFYYRNHYSGMGNNKFYFFMTISLLFLLVSFLLGIFGIGMNARKGKKRCADFLIVRSGCQDMCMLFYGIVVFFSFLLCADKKTAFWGQDGWYMGVLTQWVLIALYFVISRSWQWDRMIVIAACTASAGVFFLGLLHRFSIDPLGMYIGLREETILKFLSTIGQATWYSSYLCTLFPLGLFYFWHSRNFRMRLLSGAYCVLAFSSLVTQNSDSAFLALGAVMLVLLWKAFDSAFFCRRFLEVQILVLTTFVVTGTLQLLFPEWAVPVGSLSLFFSQSLWMWAAFVMALCGYGIWNLYEKKTASGQDWPLQRAVKIRRTLFMIVAFGVFCMLLFLGLNSTGLWQVWFGKSVYQNYLYFDESWGNNRGFTWQFAVRMFGEFPLFRKLLGAGPDSFAAFAYGIPEYAQLLQLKWGESILTCAHNELLNALICYGILGAAAYAGIFFTAFKRFVRGFQENECEFGMAVALCIVSYMAHNFFCYQQVVCTPFLFVLMAMAESVLRRKKKDIFNGK